MKKVLNKYGSPHELFLSKGTEAAKHVIAVGMATSFYLNISLKFDPYVSTGQIVSIPIKEEVEVHLTRCNRKESNLQRVKLF
ncbi:hypothetical protein [Paenibacillus sp. sgz302251]|uniref:hypothetical protein n=1 Tax=Paenibacillus sp. sgz302251 TaxID=3414493 RepID=UPI003C7E9F31